MSFQSYQICVYCKVGGGGKMRKIGGWEGQNEVGGSKWELSAWVYFIRRLL